MSEKSSEKMSTKVLVIIFIGVAFLAGYLVARARYKPQIENLSSMVIERDEKISFLNNLRNRLIYRDDQLIQAKDGEVRSVEEAVLLTDGSRVTLEGVVVRPNGEEEELTDGDSVFMDGSIIENEEVEEMQEKEN